MFVALKRLLLASVFISFLSVYSCTQIDLMIPDHERVESNSNSVGLSVYSPPYSMWSPSSIIKINQYAPLNFSHQSAAAYGDYALFVSGGRSKMCLYNLKCKEILYTLDLKSVNKDTFHCNQSSFGTTRYDTSDPFPLFYLSQRAQSDQRCFVEVFRILPRYNEAISGYDSFSIQLVQTIYFPAMSYENSLGNANCVIDSD